MVTVNVFTSNKHLALTPNQLFIFLSLRLRSIFLLFTCSLEISFIQDVLLIIVVFSFAEPPLHLRLPLG